MYGMFSRIGMSHEQNIALDMLESHLSKIHFYTLYGVDQFTLNLVTNQGNFFFYDGHLTTPQIPRENYWKWNQSRGKTELDSNSNHLHLSFCKLNSRNIPPALTAPPYKIWVFNITDKTFNRKYGFFWCEKGFFQPTLDDNLLRELSFLQDFVSKDTADELGWTKPIVKKKSNRGRKKKSTSF
mmetsp:Transcript_17381/g.29593  ORF Transcript_17381/g.29593 Transcript_17381/m.29593 type:complete len:183 (-) Transcript_17381:98-646(-)